DATPKAIVMEFVPGGDLFESFHSPDADVLAPWRAYEAEERRVRNNSQQIALMQEDLGRGDLAKLQMAWKRFKQRERTLTRLNWKVSDDTMRR
ncbi:MAG TPA: hypothetical protein V6D20_14665, partial [Candidatus Obscuribacterales bacterium]